MRWLISTAMLCLLSAMAVQTVEAQTREEKVRADREKITEAGFWIYNDLDSGFDKANKNGKPLLVVLRCIPCVECVKLDDELVDQDPVIRPLLEQFVCVRIVSTNGLDLSIFQFDTDQSFAVFMLNADGTIYGRFGTRSHRTEWYDDVSLPGLAKALEGALNLHENYPENRHMLAGKQPQPLEFSSPEKYPSLKEKYTDSLDYGGNVVKSCIHCHQIGDARRDYYWSQNKPLPGRLFFPYPHPKSLGLILDPETKATVKEVEQGSLADKAGFQKGDQLEKLQGQPLLSIADVQWALEQVDPAGGRIYAEVLRSGQSEKLSLNLPEKWREAGDLSWRVSSWQLRRKYFGGMKLDELSAEERQSAKLDEGKLSLLVKHVGRYHPHNFAQRSGIRPGDILLEFDGQDDLLTETDLFIHANENFQAGEKVPVKLLRNGREMEVTLRLP